jgi:DNA-binding XRE family transcriptional regulator
MKDKPLQSISLDEVTDKYIGKPGSPKREAFDNELRLDLLGEAIKQARKERHLTQEELGQLVGVKKAQISKLENSLTDARFDTIIKVFKALNARVSFNVELLNQIVKLA